jgi:hypothetical protein
MIILPNGQIEEGRDTSSLALSNYQARLPYGPITRFEDFPVPEVVTRGCGRIQFQQGKMSFPYDELSWFMHFLQHDPTCSRVNLRPDRPDMKRVFWSALENLCDTNGIYLKHGQHHLTMQEKFLLYASPMLRNEIWHPEITLCNIIYEHDIHPALFSDTFKESVLKTTGLKSARILKLIGRHMYIRKYKDVSRMVELNDSDHYRALATEGYAPFPSSSRHAQYTTFSKVEVSFAIYRSAAFAFAMFPPDYAYKFLEKLTQRIGAADPTIPSPYPDPRYRRKEQGEQLGKFFQSKHTPKKLFNLLNNTEIHLLDDIRIQYEAYKDPDKIPRKLKEKYPDGLTYPKKVKTLKELHDKISQQYREIKAEAENKKIEYAENELVLDGLEVDGFKFVLPHESKTLVQWGADMKNCVASYADKAARKDCLLIGVEIDGALAYNIEMGFVEEFRVSDGQKVKSGKLTDFRQFYGPSNSKPDEALYRRVTDIIKENLKLEGQAA